MLLDQSTTCQNITITTEKHQEVHFNIVDKGGGAVQFTNDNITVLFEFKEKTIGKTGSNGTKNVAIIVPLKISD